MKRRETAEIFPRPVATAMARPTMRAPRIGLIALVGMLLVLLLGSGTLRAEPADALAGALPHVAAPLIAAVTFSPDRAESAESADDAADAPAVPGAAKAAVDVPPGAADPSRAALAELLIVRGSGVGSWKPQTTDEVLAAAVANGTNPDLEPRNPFRRRSRDLFRTERPVSIGNADMLLRLRLRAKTRKAVSVELRF